MGICNPHPKFRLVTAKSLFSKDKRYRRSTICRVKQRNSSNKIIGFRDLKLTLPPPIEISSQKAFLLTNTFWLSSCVLPSTTPKSSPPKPCQDNCRVHPSDSLIFLTLFDGYGSEGSKVAELCISESESFFYSKIDPLIPPSLNFDSFFKDLAAHLDAHLCSQTDQNLETSGW
jgi:hypothetical protein